MPNPVIKTIINENEVVIEDIKSKNKAITDYFSKLLTSGDNQSFLKHDRISNDTWTEFDIIEACKQCSDSKALGDDWFGIALLQDKEVGQNLRLQLVKMLNEDRIPSYLKTSRLILLSKNNKTSAKIKDTRPIAILS